VDRWGVGEEEMGFCCRSEVLPRLLGGGRERWWEKMRWDDVTGGWSRKGLWRDDIGLDWIRLD
jgi:hypothetical protein